MSAEKKRLVLASGNKGKIKEIGEMLPDFEVVGYKDLGFDFEIDETGKTFYENALIKAKAVTEASGLSSLADDSGLCVNALGGAPGIFSARYAGDGCDEHNIDKLLYEMKNVKDRSAKFVCSLVLYSPDGEIISASGETFGKILTERAGKNGFGYDPVFFSEDLQKSLGEASFEEKNSVSHRARALYNLKERLGII